MPPRGVLLAVTWRALCARSSANGRWVQARLFTLGLSPAAAATGAAGHVELPHLDNGFARRPRNDTAAADADVIANAVTCG
jgi:hypothetical protein